MLDTEQQEQLYSQDFSEAREDGLPAAYARQARYTPEGVEFAEGWIAVAPIGDGKVCEAKIVWDRDYGEQVLEVGPVADVLGRITEITLYGPAFGPAYQSGPVRFLHHPIDGSHRMVTAQGEMRLKRFLQQRVVLFIPHNPGGRREGEAVRIVQMSSVEVGPFVHNVHTRGSQWSRGRFLAIFYCGRLHKLRVSNFPGELAFARLDDDSRLVLVPHASPEGDKPAQVEVQLIRVDVFRGETTQRLGTCPIDADLAPDSREQVVWSDGSGTSPSGHWTRERGSEEPAATGVPFSPRVHRSVAAPQDAGTQGRKVTPEAREVQGPPHPAMMPLLIRYFGDLAEKSGVAKGLRSLVCLPGVGGEIAPMMRACLRGVNMRGRGDTQWRDFETVGEFKSVWHTRTRYYLLAQLESHGIVCRRCVDSTQRLLAFGEFCNPYSLASKNLCALYRTTPERVLAEWENSETAERGAAHQRHEPPPPAPPPPPPSTAPNAGQGGAPTSAPSSPATEPTMRGSAVDPVPTSPRVPPPSTAVAGPFPNAPSSATPPPRQAPPHPHPAARQPVSSPGPNPAKQPPAGPFRAHEPGPSPLTAEPLGIRIRRFYPSDDREIEDISDDDDDGSARGPPRTR